MHCRDFRLLTAPVTLAAPIARSARRRTLSLQEPQAPHRLRARGSSATPLAGSGKPASGAAPGC